MPRACTLKLGPTDHEFIRFPRQLQTKNMA
jgi:hypothetical protein